MIRDALDTDLLKILPFKYRTALKTEIRISYERFTEVGDLLADAKNNLLLVRPDIWPEIRPFLISGIQQFKSVRIPNIMPSGYLVHLLPKVLAFKRQKKNFTFSTEVCLIQ